MSTPYRYHVTGKKIVTVWILPVNPPTGFYFIADSQPQALTMDSSPPHHSATNSNKNNGDDEDDNGVTANSYGTLQNTATASNNACWLIRVPQTLLEVWEAAEEGTQLGELIFTKGGVVNNSSKKKLNPTLEVSVSEILAKSHAESNNTKRNAKPTASATPHPPGATRPSPTSDQSNSNLPIIPLNYSLQALTNKVPPIYPFTRHPTNGSCQLLGVVSRTANLQVQRDANYRALLKDRLLHHTIQSKQYVKSASATDSIVKKNTTSTTASAASTNKKRSFGNAVLQFGKRQLEASHSAAAAPTAATRFHPRARSFAPDQSLRSVVFQLFALQPYWTVKELKAAAAAGGCTAAVPRKAEAELRDLLKNELAVYHRSGDHKTKWELREEFRTAATDAAGSGASGGGNAGGK